ncbi:hypothetical protein [Planctomyces sp. SH-PL14]|uniref:hypothetical protein n=1 Tax=Planctomyces sp. SH-PL14 TaxID=1632864 RepID=UPI00078C00EE|nr:hypothetical protein [Planctomyces sp. SH-PL14]AMV19634.1 hypothetical protein VT03_17190 [Planctomyces sp. SH-PL14]
MHNSDEHQSEDSVKIPFSVYDFFAFLATGFIVLCAADYAFDLGWLQKDKLPPGMIVFLTLGAYVLGHIVANLSSYFLEHKFLRGVLKSPEETLFIETVGGWSYLFPIFYKPFPVETQKKILDRAKAAGLDCPGRGLFFHCHTIVKRDKGTADRLSNFLNVYGFCRNACMASLIAAAMLFVAAVRHLKLKSGAVLDGDKLVWAGVAVLVAVGLFYRYLKFFKHYTEEVFRDYAEPATKS